MAVQMADNFSIKGEKPDVERQMFETISDMVNYPEYYLPDIYIATCVEDGSIYVFNKANEIDEITGKWRELSDGVAVLTEDVIASSAIGGITAGTEFKAGEPVENVIKQMFYTKPTIKMSVDCLSIYDKNDKSTFPSVIKITANVTRKTNEIKEISAYIGDTLIEKKTSLVKDGGSFSFNYVVPEDFTTCTFKVECKDDKNTVVDSKKIYVVALSYVGCLDDGVDINEENIKTLTPVLKSTVAGKYSFTTVYGRIIYAVPEEVGKITSIKDIKNNLDYWNSYNVVTQEINGEKYQVAYLIDPMGFTGAEITFG